MYQLEFSQLHDYSGSGENVVLPVVLRSSGIEVPVAASVDTGASFCLFRTEIAEVLGLALTAGILKRFRTANSGFDAYGHEVELDVLGILIPSVVYFFADPTIDKNVLGRTGWLDRIRLGLTHHDSKLYLGPYDPA